MQYYLDYDPDVFRGKTILCPCDNPQESNFTKYFLDHFEEYGIKRLISTCWSGYSDAAGYDERTTLLDLHEAAFHEEQEKKGRILDTAKGLDIGYLDDNGDFRSEEITAYRDQADMIITNPPFSYFRQFMNWIYESKAQYSVLGNINAYTYPNIFPQLKSRTMKIGASITNGDREFRVPDDYPLTASGTRVDSEGNKYVRIKGVRWFTNIPFNDEKPWLELNTYQWNEKNNKHLTDSGYQMYDNLQAIECPYVDTIPSDYDGLMGVPVTFLDKWNPDQFKMIGTRRQMADDMEFEDCTVKHSPGILYIDEKPVYDRVIIRRKK